MSNVPLFFLIVFLSLHQTVLTKDNTGKEKRSFHSRSDEREKCLESLRNFKEILQTTGHACYEDVYKQMFAGSEESFDFFKEFLLRDDLLKNLDLFEQKLIISPSSKEEYTELFYKTVETDAELKEMHEYLKENNVNVIFATLQEKQICGSAAAFVTPDPLEVGLCVKGGNTWGDIVIDFKHEVLHVKQLLQKDTVHECSFDLNGIEYTSQRMLQYQPSGEMLSKIYDKNALQTQESQLNDKINKFYDIADEVEKFFYINFQNGRPVLTPKKDVNISDSAFIENFLDKTIALSSDKAAQFFLKTRFPNLYEILDEKNYQEKTHSVYHDILRNLEKNIEDQYVAIMADLPPDQRENFRSDLEGFYEKNNRYGHALQSFCMEMQANMQSQMKQYLNWLKVPRIEGCERFQQGEWKITGSDSIYSEIFLNSENFNFNEIEKRIEKYTLEYKVLPANNYGGFFSELYGFRAAPDVFHYRNCQNPDEKLFDGSK